MHLRPGLCRILRGEDIISERTKQAFLTVPDQTPELRMLYTLLLLTYFGLVDKMLRGSSDCTACFTSPCCCHSVNVFIYKSTKEKKNSPHLTSCQIVDWDRNLVNLTEPRYNKCHSHQYACVNKRRQTCCCFVYLYFFFMEPRLYHWRNKLYNYNC